MTKRELAALRKSVRQRAADVVHMNATSMCTFRHRAGRTDPAHPEK